MRQLLNYLVSARKKRFRNGEPERPGGSQIDEQLELGWLLHGDLQTLRIAIGIAVFDQDLLPST